MNLYDVLYYSEIKRKTYTQKRKLERLVQTIARLRPAGVPSEYISVMVHSIKEGEKPYGYEYELDDFAKHVQQKYREGKLNPYIEDYVDHLNRLADMSERLEAAGSLRNKIFIGFGVPILVALTIWVAVVTNSTEHPKPTDENLPVLESTFDKYKDNTKNWW